VAKSFQVNILTSDRTLYQGAVRSLTAPGELGYLGILADHAALMTTLIPGTISITDMSGATQVIDSRSTGSLEVHNNVVTILVDM
jgi:F-type H+-transporting ATPase subunit epsilon